MGEAITQTRCSKGVVPKTAWNRVLDRGVPGNTDHGERWRFPAQSPPSVVEMLAALKQMRRPTQNATGSPPPWVRKAPAASTTARDGVAWPHFGREGRDGHHPAELDHPSACQTAHPAERSGKTGLKPHTPARHEGLEFTYASTGSPATPAPQSAAGAETEKRSIRGGRTNQRASAKNISINTVRFLPTVRQGREAMSVYPGRHMVLAKILRRCGTLVVPQHAQSPTLRSSWTEPRSPWPRWPPVNTRYPPCAPSYCHSLGRPPWHQQRSHTKLSNKGALKGISLNGSRGTDIGAVCQSARPG